MVHFFEGGTGRCEDFLVWQEIATAHDALHRSGWMPLVRSCGSAFLM